MSRTPLPALAVLDVGFIRHPDLRASRVVACRDATRARIPPFRYGDPASFAEHGTRTMLLAAGDGSASGLVSPAPSAPVVLVKVGGQGRVPRSAIVRAFSWLLAKGEAYGVRIVLCPFGDDPEDSGERSPVHALVRALERRRVVVVAAAGWDPAGEVVSPASSPHVIGVGGWDVHLDRPAHGPRVSRRPGGWKPDLLAPAVPLPVPSLERGGRTQLAGGTSFAAAMVAGAAWRLVAEHPSWGREEVLTGLATGARKVRGQPPYLDAARLRE